MDIFKKTKGLKLVNFLKQADLYPFLREIEGSSGSNVVFGEKELIMLGSNNYLGLTHRQRVIDAAKASLDKWGTGCTGSRFLNGNLSLHTKLEKKLSEFLGFEDSVVFASGFMANQGAIQALTGEGEYIFSDSENHACIIEGCQISAAKTIVYENHNMKDLEEKLKSVPLDAGKLIITDGVFSMNGSIAKYDVIHELSRKYNARTYVDEAHSLGTIGESGKGTSAHFNLKPDIIMGTFSKTFASQGGFICASKEVVDWIKHKGKTFMFSAALAPASTAAALEALEVLIEEPQLVDEVNKRASHLKKGFENLGFNTMNAETCVIPIFIGDDKKALKISSELVKQGVFVTPVVFPAVPAGHALIRCSVMATHTYEELDRALAVLKAFAPAINDQSEVNGVSLHKLLNEDFDSSMI